MSPEPVAPLIIAVDGPGGAGKTTVSRAVAGALGWAHLDTGAFYRAATLVAMIHRLDMATEAAVMKAIAGNSFDYRDGRMLVEGIDLSAPIRSAAVTAEVSRIAALPGVRMQTVRRLRRWVRSRAGRVVVEGRDIGTVVFPSAPLKVFLTARPEVRAGRRAGQTSAESAEVQENLARRDHLDSTRRHSPMVAATDATIIDTSDTGITSVVDQIVELASDRGLS